MLFGWWLMKLMFGQQVKFVWIVFAFIFATLSDNPSFSFDLKEQLATSHREIEEDRRQEIDLENRHEILRRPALGVVGAVNTRGFSLEDRLQDIPVRARKVATHGVRYGARAALAATQLRSGHRLHHLKLGFPELISWKIKRTWLETSLMLPRLL